MNSLKEVIPIFRNLLSESGVDLKDIYSQNSFTVTHLSKISPDGTSLSARSRNDTIIVYDLNLGESIFVEKNKNDINTNLFNALLDVDIYGENAYEVALDIQNRLLSYSQLEKLRKVNIGLNQKIDITGAYETVHNVRWKRVNLKIKFIYKYETFVPTQVIENIDEIKIKNIS